MLDKNTVISNVRRYADEVRNSLNPVAVILYGSYAKGTATDDSDIDVAVIFNGFNGDWLETSAKLWKLRRNISDDIEPILLDRTNDKSGFIENIYKTGQIIYQV